MFGRSASRHWMSIAVLLVVILSGCASRRTEVVTRSPDGNLSIDFGLRENGDQGDVPHFRVRTGNAEVVEWSRLGADFADGGFVGGPSDVVLIDRRTFRDEYTQHPGKRRHVVADTEETLIRLRERTDPHREWEIMFRAYDDGVAFRYRFLPNGEESILSLAQERTSFVLPARSHVYALTLRGFDSAYEDLYEIARAKDLDEEWFIGLPLLYEVPGGGWAAITEADLVEYAGIYLVPTPGSVRELGTKLAPLPDEPDVAVRAPLPHMSPWRVVMLGETAGSMIESDIVLTLSRPNAIGDTSWIKPGKTMFPWWNGFYDEGVDFEPGLNFETMKHYIDFAADNGVPYHSLDGIRGQAWYGGPIRPYDGADITTAREEMQLERVIAHANERGVRLRLWMHWEAAAEHMDRAFPLYREWGIEGIMLDFMNRDDQEMHRFLERAIRLAAENELTVTLHGSAKPTGLERMYPNLLNYEGVYNLEYNKFVEDGCPPGHQVIVPYARMLAGPLDFHQGSFRAVPPEEFEHRGPAPLVIGTPTRNLAMYVVYQNHLQMMCDYPAAYSGHPALPTLVQIPDTWDDTRFVSGEVGEYAAIARRKDGEWHLGAMVGDDERTLRLSLDFLGEGTHVAQLWLDDLNAPHGMSFQERTVTADEILYVECEVGGGVYGKFTPVD